MKTYPRLTEMGVLNPRQINKFSVNSIGYTDALSIGYDRPKGSVLPVSKTFKFPRIQKSAKADSGATRGEDTMVSDPAFREALDELQDILDTKGSNRDFAAEIIEEVRLLEEDIALRSEYLRVLADKIKAG